MLRNIDTKQRIYDVVKKIPVGRVGTYGQVARKATGTGIDIDKEKDKEAGVLLTHTSLSVSISISPRMVGKALHQNPDPEGVPCYRVVNSKGRVAESYAFGGAEEQKKKLIAEGVSFRDSVHVNLEECLWQV